MAARNKGDKKEPMQPRPSASVVLVSPKNQVLLLHRVQTSSSFPSAHVFPGGNVDPKQDGALPPAPSFERHQDSPAYRLAAIRECFEESGLLLAKRSGSASPSGLDASHLLSVSSEEREDARRRIHRQELRFVDWVESKGGLPDVDGLYPFTRFVTPTTAPKRFSTQMYIYFLPLEQEADGLAGGEQQERIPVPTSDGGVEHTTAQFLWPGQWKAQAKANEIIVWPPQMYLLTLIEPFFSQGSFSRSELEEQRRKCRELLKTEDPPFSDKVMSPDMISFDQASKRAILGIFKPGPELAESGRCGDPLRVVLVRNTREGPRDVEVRWKEDVMKELRDSKASI